jgi:TPR repeat protein
MDRVDLRPRSMRHPTHIGILTFALTVLPLSALSASLNPGEMAARAAELMQDGQFALARSYLAPALIHPALSPEQRAHAYYLSGLSFVAERQFVSARKDFHRALEFFEDHGGAQAALGNLYTQGLGIETNVLLGITLFSRAAELGDTRALFYLGHAYIKGLGVEQDLARGRALLAQAADAGEVTAMVHLGASYRAPDADPPEPVAALDWYDRAIEAGDASAMVAKAYMLRKGELDAAQTTYPEAARKLLEQAAALHSDPAILALAHIHLNGEGVPKDPATAHRLLAEAAQRRSSPDVLFLLGHLQDVGLGTARDLAAARESYKAAARLGHPQAMSRLAQQLMQQADPAAHAQAGYWLAQAARNQTPRALNDYAWFLATSPVHRVRDGALAVTHARAAVAKVSEPGYLDTLAAAYAEAGDFEAAVQTQRQAIADAAAQEPELVAELTARLAVFEARKPWRESPAN